MDVRMEKLNVKNIHKKTNVILHIIKKLNVFGMESYKCVLQRIVKIKD